MRGPILLLGTLLLVASILEGGARWLDQPSPDTILATGDTAFDWRDPAPYVVFRSTPNADARIHDGPWVTLQVPEGGSAHVVTDQYGFRYAGDLDEPKAPNELRVFLLGGSVVVGGLTNETTIAGHLETLLSARLPRSRVRVVNAGIMTGVSDQELAMLTHWVSRLQPDIVISLSGFNDAILRERFEPRIGYPAPWREFERIYREGRAASRRVVEDVEALPLWRLLASRSRFVTTLWPGLSLPQQLTANDVARAARTGGPNGDSTVASPEQIVDRLIRNWDLMGVVSHGLDAEFIGVLQPFRKTERDAGELAAVYDSAIGAIRSLSATGKPYYSFDRILDGREELFFDPVHTFDEGNRLLAIELSALLDRQGWLDPPVPPSNR